MLWFRGLYLIDGEQTPASSGTVHTCRYHVAVCGSFGLSQRAQHITWRNGTSSVQFSPVILYNFMPVLTTRTQGETCVNQPSLFLQWKNGPASSPS